MALYRVASKLVPAGALAAGFGLVLQPRGAAGQAVPAKCGAWDVEYALSATLTLMDTPLGEGNGDHAIGPGTLVLRFEDTGGRPGGRVKLVSYEVRQTFDVVSKNVLATTRVTTDAMTRKAPDRCGTPAEGQLTGATLGWNSPVSGFGTDGALTCEGFFCGKFGAPPPGRSALHLGPDAVRFQPFRFSGDMKTFSMPSTLVSKTDTPKQTAYVALSGRETRRACALVNSCK